MTDVNLIPAAFSRQLLLRQWLKQSGISLLVLTVLVMGSFFWLRFETSRLNQQSTQLQSQKAISMQQRSNLNNLSRRKTDLQQQLDLLTGLRSGVTAEQIFVTMDRAVTNDNVWFTNWHFRRAGTPVKKTTNEVHTGYFVVITDREKNTEETWQIETQMKIEGGALDHATLSSFVSRLIDQPEIQSVRVVRTEQILRNQNKLVKFSLEVIVSMSVVAG